MRCRLVFLLAILTLLCDDALGEKIFHCFRSCLSVCLFVCVSLCVCVCLSVCLSVFLSVQAITFEPLDIETSFFGMQVHLDHI